MKIYFATANKGKFKECKEFMKKHGIKVRQKKIELLEIQANTLEEVAKFKIREAYEKIKAPVFVEDAGLFIKALKGFPGVYSSYVYKTIGCKGVLKLMENAKEREADFKAVIAFANKNGKIKIFKEVCKGRIALQEKGKSGFGFDPIFIPRGYEKTFAEDFELKQKLSHRVKALEKFAKYLRNFGKNFI